MKGGKERERVGPEEWSARPTRFFNSEPPQLERWPLRMEFLKHMKEEEGAQGAGAGKKLSC